MGWSTAQAICKYVSLFLACICYHNLSNCSLLFALYFKGWRKTMEDAHMAYTDLSEYCGGDNSVPLALFGVFDGHGGMFKCSFLVLLYIICCYCRKRSGKICRSKICT